MNNSPSPNEHVPPGNLARFMRRTAFTFAALFALIVLFYAVENWRGRRAWAECQEALRAQGEPLDWAAFVPARVPDEQNFIQTPLLEAIGYTGRVNTNVWLPISAAEGRLVWNVWGDFQSGRTMDWSRYDARPRTQPDPGLPPSPQGPAAEFLEACQEIEPQLEELRAACVKPSAQFDLDRSAPFEEGPSFNFRTIRALAQILAFQACAELELNHPEKAFADVRVIHRLADGLKNENTLVATMIRVALQGLALQPFWDGWAAGRWNDRELAGFQELFAQVDLLPELTRVIRAERVGVTALVEKYGIQRNELWRVATRSEPPPQDFWGAARQPYSKVLWGLVPRGWVYQNLAVFNWHAQEGLLPSLRSQPPTVSPAQIGQIEQRRQREDQSGPYRWLVRYAAPNFAKAVEATARTQTGVNQARIVCALERCRKARGQYPESLSDLVPEFIDRLPRDVFTGGPLQYRRANDGRFVLYSVGWNGQDDGGVPGTPPDAPAKLDYRQGDWVWQHPTAR